MVASPRHHRSRDDCGGKLHAVRLEDLENSPVHGGNIGGELASKQVFLFLCLDKRVDTLGFLKGWDASTHPGRAARKLVVRRKYWPVEGILERYQSVDCANGGVPECGVAVGVAISISIGLSLLLHPRGRNFTTTRGLEIFGVLYSQLIVFPIKYCLDLPLRS